MIRIAICSGEKKMLDEICELVRNYAAQESGREIEPAVFDSARGLIGALEVNIFFNAFLIDAALGDEAGIALARDIRERGSEAPVIYVDTATDNAPEIIEIGVTRYLLKPIAPEQFYEAMDAVGAQLEMMGTRFIKLKTENGVERIAINQIVYSEAHGHYQYVTRKDGTQFRVRMTVTELLTRLSKYGGFIRIGAAYIVNLRHAQSVTSTELCLCNDISIKFPRGRYQETKNEFLNFQSDL